MNITKLSKTLHIIAMALGKRYNIKVEIGGQRAATDGSTIVLPTLPIDNEEVVILAHGYIDHEAGHVRFTDFDAIREKRSDLMASFINILEDVRIESLLGNIYPGCKTNLNRLVSKLVNDGVFCTTDDTGQAALISNYMIHRLRHDVLGQQALKDIADISEEKLKNAVPLGTYVRLKALMFDVMKAQSTSDVVDLAAEIIEMIKEEQEKERQNSKNEQGREQSDSGRQQSGGQSSNDQSADQTLTGAQEDQGVLDKILNAKSEDLPRDLGQILADALNAKAMGCGQSDKLETMEERTLPSTGNAQAIISAVRHETNALRYRMEGLMQAESIGGQYLASSGRKLSTRHAYRAATCDQHLFIKSEDAAMVDTAVVILIDNSRSMHGLPIEIASNSAMAVGLALESVEGVATCIAGFPEINILLDFDETLRKTAGRLEALRAGGGTPLAEALIWAGSRILARQEPRKIILAITDGEPNNEKMAKSVIEMAMNDGIEMIGIGIKHDVSRLFPKSGYINSIKELPATLFGVLNGSLTHYEKHAA